MIGEVNTNVFYPEDVPVTMDKYINDMVKHDWEVVSIFPVQRGDGTVTAVSMRLARQG